MKIGGGSGANGSTARYIALYEDNKESLSGKEMLKAFYNDFGPRGIRLGYLRELMVNEGIDFSTLSISDVCTNFVIPVASAPGETYCDYLRDRGG